MALIGLTGVWLAALIWQSPKDEVTKRGWKSSPVAMLLAGVSEAKLLRASTDGIKTSRDEEKAEEEGPLVLLFDTSRSGIAKMAA